MTSAEEAVVTPRDWILGIAFSILASIIGGASKLSIRKSWIIDERRKQRIRPPYEEVTNTSPNISFHDDGRGFENETNLVAPLEVDPAPPPRSMSNHSQESCSSRDGDGHASLDNGNKLLMLDPQHGIIAKILSPKRTSWILYLSGMVGMSFLNPLCCVLAMRYANPSILAPFSGLTLVWVVLFSAVTLDEHPGKSQKVACALIILGEVLVAIFGDHTNEEDKSVDDVLSSYQEPAFRAFMVFMTLFLVQLGIFIWVCPKTSLLRKVSWGSIGGSITGFQNFLKDTLTIYHAATKHSQNSLSSGDGGASTTSLPPELFLFMALGALTAFVGLLFLAACMKRYDATYSAAMFVVSFVLSASLMSSVHYHTFGHLAGWLNYVMYPSGLAILFLGAFMLVKPKAFAGWCGGFLSGDAASEEEKEEDDGEPFYSEENVRPGVI